MSAPILHTDIRREQDVVLARQIATRETGYSRPLDWLGFSKVPLVRDGEALRKIGESAELFDDHSPLQLGVTVAVTTMLLGLALAYTIVRNKGTLLANALSQLAFLPLLALAFWVARYARRKVLWTLFLLSAGVAIYALVARAAGAGDACGLCSVSCAATPLFDQQKAATGFLPAGTVPFPPLLAPPPSHPSEGPERPPRTA